MPSTDVSSDLSERSVLWAASLTQRVATIGVVGMLGIAVLSTFDVVVMRYAFNSPIPGSNELFATVFAVAIAAVLASGLAQNANLEIDLLGPMWGPSKVKFLRVAGAGVLLSVLVLVFFAGLIYAFDAQVAARQTTVMQLPMAPFFWLIVGLIALCIPVQLAMLTQGVASLLPPSRRTNRRTALLLLAFLAGISVAGFLVYTVIALAEPIISNHPIAVSFALFGLLWVLILNFVPVSAAMILSGLIGAAAVLGFDKAISVVSTETMDLITNSDLAVIPLFLLMGGFATAGGLASDIYRFGNALLGWARGGLAMATVVGSAGFGAFTGSSLATVATIGQAALPEMRSRSYSVELSVGSVAAGGTLGQLVPPSTAIVLYALLTESSIGALYIAVLLPALVTILFYLAAIRIVVWLKPQSAPVGEPFDIRLMAEAARGSAAVLFMFLIIIGGIYSGIFTVNEAAAVGAVFAFCVALIRRRLSGGAIWQVAAETTRSTSMIYFIMIGAQILSFSIGTSGLSEAITTGIASLNVPAIVVIVMLVIVYILLGMVLDSFAVMVITASMSAGIVQTLGYDPLWWGVMMVILVEIGVVTPPFGLNLFGVKALVSDVPLAQIYRGVIPFVIADFVKVAIFIAIPSIILMLPRLAAH